MTIDPQVLERMAENWRNSDECQWSIADDAALVVGRYEKGATQEIADALAVRIGKVVSVDRIERRARAGRAFKAISERVPSAVNLRKFLTVSYFEAVGKAVENGLLDWSDAYEWLMDCLSERWTVEKLRAQLPTRGEGKDYRKTATKYLAHIDYDLINAPVLGVDENKAARVMRAAKLLKGRLQDLLGA